MASTPAERQRKRRALIKSDPTLHELYKLKDRQRKQERRETMNEKELSELRQSTYEAVIRHRKRKMEEVDTADDQHEEEDQGVGYKSAQSLGKARRRMEQYLPKSPGKKRQLVSRLAEDVLHLDLSSNPKPSTDKGISNESKDLVVKFYEKDDISKMMPGRKDYKVVKTTGGKESRQKRVMVLTVHEAYAIFNENNPGLMKVSKFASLRPEHVMLASRMPHNVCGCKLHSDIILLLESLHRKLPNLFPLYSFDFLENVVCDTESEECMINDCATCKDGKLFSEKYDVKNPGDKITYVQWEEDECGFLEKKVVHSIVGEAVQLLREKLPRFLWHHFVKRCQSKYFEIAKQQNDSKSCTVQMDFAENYTIEIQDSIQSQYWKKKQISLYTVVIWFEEKSLSLLIASDLLSHEKKSVTSFTCFVIEEIKTKFPTVEKVKTFTDGPSSQFKNRYIASSIPEMEKKYGLQIEWNYFASGHGKGPVDGVGGIAKRTVYRRCMAGATITNANDFCEILKASGTKIEVHTMSASEIDKRSSAFEEVWANAPLIRGIQNIHHIISMGPNSRQLLCKFYTSASEGNLITLPEPVSIFVDI